MNLGMYGFRRLPEAGIASTRLLAIIIQGNVGGIQEGCGADAVGATCKERPGPEMRRSFKKKSLHATSSPKRKFVNDIFTLYRLGSQEKLARIIQEGLSRGGADGHECKVREGKIPQATRQYVEESD